MKKVFLCSYLSFTIIFAFSQQKLIEAVKINLPIKIDGNLDEAAWASITPVSDFIITSPVFGKPATKKTTVKITYDNTAVYIGAYLYDNIADIKKGLSARDVIERQNTDYFSIGLDTYKDNQNGFLFQVTAAGVQGDAKLSGSSSGVNIFNNNGVDRSWDAVWESKVSIKKDGWVAEIKIPFSAIRFAKTNLQKWGLQFTRFLRGINESSSWSPEDPNINGGINQWGTLDGLKNIMPPLRLSFLPYLSAGFKISPVANGTVTEFLKSGGMDVKYGINESFTLDMTLIPDFAQVQSDNIILNLSPFEVKFNDFRPFFTEGTELFNKAEIFYARRIGATPQGLYNVLALAIDSPQYKIIKNPGITRLYNATKLSGRTKHNLGIGILNSVAAEMNALVENTTTGKQINIQTEPLTNYNVVVLDQAFNNKSSITFTNTNVLRKGNSRNANVTSLDISMFDKKNIHQLYLAAKYSAIWGKLANSNGYRADAQYSKVSGTIQYNIYNSIKSDTYNPNDLGFLLNNNSVDMGGAISYNNFKPTKKYLNQRYQISLSNSYLYKPFTWQKFSVEYRHYVLFKNFWDVNLQFFSQPSWSNDFFEPRTPGKVLKRSPFYFLALGGSTDSRKKLFYNYFFGYAESPLPNDPYYNIQSGFRYRFNDKFQMSINASIEKDKGNWGFVYRDVAGAPIIGRRDLKTNSTVLSALYNFNAKMNLNVRLRHYWRQVHYTGFYNLKDDGYWTEKNFVPGYDQNFNTFNVDMFYTWDFLLGSRITLTWKNALGTNVNIDGVANQTYLKNFSSVFKYPHSNELSIKAVYYIDYLTLKKSVLKTNN